MPNTLIKTGASVAVLGSVTTGSYFLRGYYTSERIAHRINNQGMTLLTSGDSEAELAKRWKDYINHNNPWKLENYEENKANKDKVPQNFKNKCLYDAYLAIEGSENMLTQIQNYCTKSFPIKEMLKKNGITLLTKSDSNETWKAAYGNYFNGNKTNSNPLNIHDWFRLRNQNKMPTDYQDKCEAATNHEVKSAREDNYLKVKSYCTK